jgi:hypothetical protein
MTAVPSTSGIVAALVDALEPFASFAVREPEDGPDVDDAFLVGLLRERIVDWMGPSDFRRARAAHAAGVLFAGSAVPRGGRGTDGAPRDGTPVLLTLRDDLASVIGRQDLEIWQGATFVARHDGVAASGRDRGWAFVAPVGHFGFPDAWVASWRELPGDGSPSTDETEETDAMDGPTENAGEASGKTRSDVLDAIAAAVAETGRLVAELVRRDAEEAAGPQRLPGSVAAVLGTLLARANEKRDHWSSSLSELQPQEGLPDDEGETPAPLGDDEARALGYAHGRKCEADSWIHIIEATVRDLPGDDGAEPKVGEARNALVRAFQTACNDDMSHHGTDKRKRHVERAMAMLGAIDELDVARAGIEAARDGGYRQGLAAAAEIARRASVMSYPPHEHPDRIAREIDRLHRLGGTR